MRICALYLLLGFLTPGSSPAQDVRVRIYSAHPPDSLVVQATKGQLRWKSCPKCPEQTDQRLLVESLRVSPAFAAEAAHKEFFVTGDYQLLPPNGPSFSADFPLHIETLAGALLVVVSMPLEQYVQHVLMAESGEFEDSEALKAMGVTARSYAKAFQGQHSREGFDFCDTTHCQVFAWTKVAERIRAGVDGTQGEYVAYQGKPAATFYHQNCGGTTAAASEAWAQVSEPYLVVHADPFCLVRGGLPWETTLTHEQIDRALRRAAIEPPESWQAIEIRSRTASGRVRVVNLSRGRPATFALSASSLRFAVNRVFGWNHLRSDWFDVHDSGGGVLFSGRGAGHGVGLCQAGAEEMAREGKTYKEILSFYYPGTQVIGGNREAWQKRSGERLDLISSDPDTDSSILPVAERVLREAERDLGWGVPFRIQLQVFPSLASYRDVTGQPGWVAASTRGQTIRLQPLGDLRRRAILESTLRHELYHLLVETRAARSSPLWFREGLTLYLSSAAVPDAATSLLTVDQIEQILKRGDTRENTQKAYSAAHRMVARLIQQNGKQTVLDWLRSGLPAGMPRNSTDLPTLTPRDRTGQ